MVPMNERFIPIPDGPRPPAQRYFARAAGRRFDAALIDGGTVEIALYDEIGPFGVSAAAFRERVNEADGRDIVLRINSPGGDVFDGVAMYNDLVEYRGRVAVEVVGVAASAASIIAMAGDTIEIAENAFFMIHNAWAVGVGDHTVMEELAAVLDRVDQALAATYGRRTGIDEGEIAAMMDAETWFSGGEAVDRGFADALIEAPADAAANARFDLSRFKNAPATTAGEDIGHPRTVRDLETGMRAAGFSQREARRIAARAKAIAGLEGDAETDEDSSALAAALAKLHATLAAQVSGRS